MLLALVLEGCDRRGRRQKHGYGTTRLLRGPPHSTHLQSMVTARIAALRSGREQSGADSQHSCRMLGTLPEIYDKKSVLKRGIVIKCNVPLRVFIHNKPPI